MSSLAAHIDFETRSVLDLREVAIHRYSRHPETDVWCLGWAIGDEDPQLWLPGQLPPARLVQHVRSGAAAFAHNAPFELAIWGQILAPRYGFPELLPQQTYCTMAEAYAMGLPGSLKDAAMALGCTARKDVEGRKLMLKMCKPRGYENGQPVWWDDPELIARLGEYCKQDVVVERAMGKRLMHLSNQERKVWLMDYAINQRGIKVDTVTAEAALKLADVAKVGSDAKLAALTGGAVTNATALIPLKTWLADKGVVVDSLAKAVVTELLATDLPPDVRTALEIRREASKASVSKLKPMLAIAGDDGRIRNTLQYHGAATGRWAGRKVQPHNFPRDVPAAEIVEATFELIRAGDITGIEGWHGPPMKQISRCLRGFLTAGPGKRLIPCDFNSIEGRGVAWFSGEKWKLDAFKAADNGTGPGIYELAYAKSFGVSPDSVKNPSTERQIGKVQELAFGYQGGVGAARMMAAIYGFNEEDATYDSWKSGWRGAHPAVVKTWYDLQRAAMAASRTPGKAFTAGYAGRQVKYKKVGSFLWCLLPSGRALCYPYPKILDDAYGDKLTYMSVPSQDDRKKGRIIADPGNSNNWARLSTYGGSLMENVIQAICRDLLAEAMLELEGMGIPVVLHVHDELVAEVEEGRAEAARHKIDAAMRKAPAWAAGFPLWAESKVMVRYGK